MGRDRPDSGDLGTRESAVSEQAATTTFGALLRRYRRQCQDPDRGGLLTQERLGELLGRSLGHAGYSGAAISDWERDKSKIDEDDRLVLTALLSVLRGSGGLKTVREANELLHAGNYRALNPGEQAEVFPERSLEPAATSGVVQPDVPRPLRQKLPLLLEKVQRFWIEGLLRTTLAGSPPLEVTWEAANHLVAQPWEGVVAPPSFTGGSERSILGEFDRADRALLILGEAGSGKTTLLLKLASALAKRAEGDPAAPVPVVLNLSTWAADRRSLQDWLTEELIAKYQIPRRIARPWLEDDTLVLLLDGFDEVPAALRAACIRAINLFRRRYGLAGVAVCSRNSEYEAAGMRLNFGGAILLQPLAAAQRDAYLAAGGASLLALRAAVLRNETLGAMARSPLFLNVLSSVFRDTAPGELETLTAGTRARAGAASRQLFSAYEERMLQSPRPGAYPSAETRRWLAWLAAQMSKHSEVLFLLEDIQPSWLSPPDRRLYLALGHAVIGLAGGFIMWLLLLFLHFILPDLPTAMAGEMATLLNLSTRYAELLVLITGNLVLALVVLLIHTWTFEKVTRGSHRVGDRFLRRRGLLVGVVTGLVTAVAVFPLGGLIVALSWGIAEGIMFGMVSRFLIGPSYRRDIRPIEALAWSWREARQGVVLGLLLAAVAEILETLLFGYNGILRSLLTFTLVGFLFGGLSGHRIEEKAAYNQGIRLSLRNALLAALLVAVSLGVLTWILRTPETAVIVAFLLSLTVFPFFGGATVLKHYLLRVLLWRAGHMPLPYGRFLEHATQFGLTRRAGGGFIFFHRLLQDHFAAQEETVSQE